jgi:deferrochelatase/peroxidase EfeB
MADPNNVQSIVARSSAKPLTTVLLFKLSSPQGVKAFLREWRSAVPSGAAKEQESQPSLHFLFSWPALELLLEGHPTLDVNQGRREFETFFVDPVQAPGGPAVAEQLGFVGDSSPAGWWDRRFTSTDIGLALHILFDAPDQRTSFLEQLRRSAASNGLHELKVASFPDGALGGSRPSDGVLHFGYRDGISTIQIDWNDEGAQGTVNFREFFLGYPTENYPVVPAKAGPWQDFAREGSFAGVTWIHQNVGAFNSFLETEAAALVPHARGNNPQEWLAAKLMGRWRNGSPLAKYTDALPRDPKLDDDFGYAEDPLGLKCPVTSHIRVANSRDQTLKFADRVRFPGGPPRLIRRGFSYGPRLEGPIDDGQERGVVGVFFFARVNEQFYTVLRWMQRTTFSEVFRNLPDGLNAQDALIGNRLAPWASKELYLRISDLALRLQLRNFIRYRGVAVLFAPSLRALQTLAE